MGQYRHPYNGEVREADGKLAQVLVHKGWAEVVPVEVAEERAEAKASELKGQALDDALRAANLPLTGNVAEKRSRLEEHLLEDVVTSDEVVDPTVPTQDPQSPTDAPEEQS